MVVVAVVVVIVEEVVDAAVVVVESPTVSSTTFPQPENRLEAINTAAQMTINIRLVTTTLYQYYLRVTIIP